MLNIIVSIAHGHPQECCELEWGCAKDTRWNDKTTAICCQRTI